MARSGPTQQAATLFIKGDPVTGRRITSISELSRITGVSRPHLQQVKADDNWQGQADKYATNCTMSLVCNGDVMDQVGQVRSVLAEKLDQALARVQTMNVTDKEFSASYGLLERVMDRWSKYSGADSFLNAQKVYGGEMAKLKAKAEDAEIRPKLRDAESPYAGTIEVI